MSFLTIDQNQRNLAENTSNNIVNEKRSTQNKILIITAIASLAFTLLFHYVIPSNIGFACMVTSLSISSLLFITLKIYDKYKASENSRSVTDFSSPVSHLANTSLELAIKDSTRTTVFKSMHEVIKQQFETADQVEQALSKYSHLDINALDGNGRTPLYRAINAYQPAPDLVIALMKRKAEYMPGSKDISLKEFEEFFNKDYARGVTVMAIMSISANHTAMKKYLLDLSLSGENNDKVRVAASIIKDMADLFRTTLQKISGILPYQLRDPLSIIAEYTCETISKKDAARVANDLQIHRRNAGMERA